MEEFKTYKDFKKRVIEHLGEGYNQEPWGIFQGNGQPYSHIVNIPEGSTQEGVIRQILKNDGVEYDHFASPHRYAHHLNSSQVVCYEFFRNLITDEKRVTDTLVKCLDAMGIPGNQFIDGHAEFEWVPYKEENTNFDFFLEGTDPKKSIYFEIKYTEQGFGTCRNDEDHKIKFDTIYKDMIDNCACLSKKPTEFNEEWRKNYQLFRNVLRITNNNWENEYVVFLFPKMNKAAKTHFENFKAEYIIPAYDEHIKEVFWEDLTEYMSNKFRQKFFFYTL